MKKLLLLLTFSLIGFLAISQDMTYFDGDAVVPSFNPGGAVYNGVVDNPFSDATNASALVGKSTTGGNSWDGIIIKFSTPLDLRGDTIFTLKVYHPTLQGETRLQFDGAGMGSQKIDVMYTTPGAWQELSFKVPSKYDGIITQVMLVFAHDRSASGEEWHFDDLLGPKTYPELGKVLYYDADDVTAVFRPGGAAYDGIVDNPLLDETNSSDKVGKSTTGPNSWDGIIMDFANTLNLSDDTIFTMMVYHPTLTGESRLHFLGAAEKKIDVMYTTPGKWQLLTFNIPKSYAGKLTGVMVVFAHDRSAAGEEWYFDELRGTETDMIVGEHLYFDFEGDTSTNPEFAESTAKFLGVVENPMKDVMNPSDSVGLSQCSATDWDGIVYTFEQKLNLDNDTIFTMLVYHPDSTGSIRLHFQGDAQLKLNEQYDTPGAWKLMTWRIPIEYDDKFERVNIVFDHNNGQAGGADGSDVEEWYFDELRGCMENAPPPVVPPKVYYSTETFRQDWAGFDGASYEGVVDNPSTDTVYDGRLCGKALTGTNGWSGMSIDLPSPIDFSVVQNFMLNVYSDSAGYVRVQLEKSGVSAVKLSVPYTTPGVWARLKFTAADNVGGEMLDDTFDRVVLIFDDKDGDPGEEWYFDNLLGPEIANVDPVYTYFDFETIETSADIYVPWGGCVYEKTGNPLKDDVNPSDSVGLCYTGPVAWDIIQWKLSSTIDFSEGHTFSMLVYSDSIGGVRIQLDDPNGKTLKMTELYETPGEWAQIDFDVNRLYSSSTGEVIDDWYRTVNFVFDDREGEVGEEWYFDVMKGPKLTPVYYNTAMFYLKLSETVSTVEIDIDNMSFPVALADTGSNSNVWGVEIPFLDVGEHTMDVYLDGSLYDLSDDVPFTVNESLDPSMIEYMVPGTTGDALVKVTVINSSATSFEVDIDNSSNMMTLYDDGTNGDESAGDGVWSLLVADLSIGDHAMDLYVDGTMVADDVAFTLESSSGPTSVEYTYDATLVNDKLFGNIKLYPNPAKEQVTIAIENENIKNVEIYNLQGKEIQFLSKVNSRQITFDVSTLFEGVYYIKVTGDKGLLYRTKMLIK